MDMPDNNLNTVIQVETLRPCFCGEVPTIQNMGKDGDKFLYQVKCKMCGFAAPIVPDRDGQPSKEPAFKIWNRLMLYYSLGSGMYGVVQHEIKSIEREMR